MTDSKDPGVDQEEFSLEGRLRRFEEIVGLLEEEELDLDRALALFEEGVSHVKEAERVLATAELKVEELLGEAVEGETAEDGGEADGLRTRPLEEEPG